MKTRKRSKRHNFVLVKGQRRLDVGKYSFSVRITNEWNKLSTDCVYTNSVNMFKNNYLLWADYNARLQRQRMVKLYKCS